MSARVGYALSRIDHDEWSWSVERLRGGETVWGSGSETLAEGCEYSKAEAVEKIRGALAMFGLTLETAVRLPF